MVRFYGILADAAGCREAVLTYEESLSIRDVLRIVCIRYLPVSDIFPEGWEDNWQQYLLVIVNRQIVSKNFSLSPGDELLLYPPPSGG